MKQLLAITALFALTFQSVSNLWILGSFYFNQQYITENLCVNRFDAIPLCKGKCYLQKQLDKQEKKEQKLPVLKQNDLKLFCTQFPMQDFTPSFFTQADFPKYKKTGPACRFCTSVFHPPKFA